MSDSSTWDDRDRKAKMEEFYFQRRVLAGCTVSLLLGVILWIIAMSTNRWYIVNGNDGLFVERTRRYFKHSQTGIWRTCRQMFKPTPSASYVVRNYTMLAFEKSERLKIREEFTAKDFVQDYLKIELPDVNNTKEIDESFRQVLFAEWVTPVKNDTQRFKDMKAKLPAFLKKYPKAVNDAVDPSKLRFPKVHEKLDGFITIMTFNGTSNITFVVPENLRFVLFKGWEDHGMKLVGLLNAYGKNLGIDPNLYKDGLKFIFTPPLPEKKPTNGFVYSKINHCTFTNLFAHDDADVIEQDPSMDETLLEYSRTAATFTIFTIFLIVLGFIFTVYTFFNPRYMFKRLAGGVHFISAATSAIVCKVMMMMYYHSKEFMRSKFPENSEFEWGYGLYFGMLVSAINFVSSIMFLWYSKKKKGDKAATEELGMADEPINIGR